MEQLDPDAVNLAKAIRQTESGGNFTAQGKSGEYGGYQFTEPTWNAWSKKYGVNVPLQQATPEQQNEVAYKQIKEWKDAGNNVGNIASLWNSGKPDAYLDTNYKGTNSHGVAYDVPAYAKSVATAYQSLKAGNSVGVDQNNPSSVGTAYKPPQPGFFQQASQDVAGGLGGAADALSNAAQGKINPLSGVLQGVGALAGGVNNLVNTGLTHLPIVGGAIKGAEDLVGQGVGALANTGPGKAVVGAAQGFSQAHPELAGDIGAGANILGTYYGLGAGGALKDVAGKAVGTALGRDPLASIVSDISPEIKAGTVKGTNDVLQNGLIKSPMTGRVSRVTDPVMQETARVIKDAVPTFSTLTTYAEKVDALDGGIEKLANQLRDNIKSQEIQPLLTPEDIQGLRQTITKQITESPLLVGDAGKSAQLLLNKFTSFLPQTGDITMIDVLNARQALDRWIKSEGRGNAFDPKMANAISTGLRLVRQGANKIIEKKLPDAESKDLLHKQTLLFKAQKNIASKASKEVGTTRFGRYAQKHPVISGLVSRAARGAVEGAGAGSAIKFFGGLP